MLLLNPGPVTLSERVRRSLLLPDLCHRESEYFALQDEARQRLLSAYDLDPRVWTAVLITGSGTAAVESMTAALVPEGGRLLNLENGVYGERIAQICSQYRIAHERLCGPWTQPLDLDVVRARTCLTQAASRTYYLDLGRLARMQDQRNTPFTPAVHAYYAMVEALREFEDEGGRTARYERYAALAEQVRGGLQVTTADMNRLLKCFARLV